MKLPDAEPDAGRGDDDRCQKENGPSGPRSPHAEATFVSWIVFPPSTTTTVPVT
jgi:hypothetical protein